MRINGRIVSQGDTINVCRGSSLIYQSTASGFTTINWKFNLGTPATSVAINPPAIVYNTNGIDSSVQFIANGANKDSLYVFIRVSDVKPIVSYFFSPNNECGNIPVSFTNSSTGNQNTYFWTFGDGTTSVALNPIHQFLSAIAPPAGSQVFNVKLVATNSFGCKDSVINPVSIKRTPDPSIGNADNSIGGVIYIPQTSTFKVCTNIPSYIFKFSNQSATIASNVSYTIIWGDGSQDSTFTSWPTSSIIQHKYTIGSNNLTIKITGPDGCIGIKNYIVFLGTNPAGGFVSLGNTNICAPDSLRFVITGFANNSPGTIYTVKINDGSPAQVFTHPPPDTITHFFTFTSCGTVSSNGTITFNNSFNATLNIENPCDLTSASVVPIYVSGKPRASIFVSPSNTVCTNSLVNIRSTSNYGGVVTSTGGGNSSCSNTGKQVWTISPATGFTLNFGSSLGTFNGNPGNGLLWISGNAILNANFSTPGIYTLKLYIFNDRCGLDSTTQTICVRNPPLATFTMSAKSACLTGSTVITNTSPLGLCLGDTYNWTVTYLDPLGCGTPGNNYSFINGTSAASVNPQLQFTAAGKYIIRLTTTANGSNFSCPTSTKADTFTVKGKPKLAINAIASICANNTIAPTAVISGCYADSVLQYNWAFTNGTPSSSTSAIPGAIDYTLLGSHPIQLTVANECGTTMGNASVNIIAPPTANAGPDKDFCSRSGVTVGTSGVTGITYQWTPVTGLNNPGIATPFLNLTYTGSNPDTVYTYIVTAAAGSNCSSKDTILIRVKKRPVVLLDPITANICAGLNVQLTASGAASYAWSPSIGLNNNNTDTVIATPPATTVYRVAGIGINGCADTASITVTIQPYPVVNAGNDSVVCNNTTAIQFKGTPAGGTWSGTNTTVTGLFSPQLSGNGVYVLKYTAALNQCSKADSILVTVIDPPVANAGTDTTVCQNNNSIRFAGSPAGGTWAGTPLVTASGDFTPFTAGIYTLIYTIGSGSCIDKDSVLINVNGNITNNIISASQSVCINTKPVGLIGLVATGGNGTPGYQWQMSTDSINWTNIAGETGLNFAPPILILTTFYRRIATTVLCNGPQGNSSIPVKITIRNDAQALFTANPATSCSPFNLGTAINVSSFNDRNGLYQWYANGTPIGSNTTGIFPGHTIFNPADTVIIKLKTSSQFGCKPDSMERQFVTVITARAKFTKDTSFGCGPLPVTFNNSSSLLNGIQFFWDFGNGIKNNLVQPGTVIFKSSPFFNDTTYKVTLKAYNGCDTTTWLDSVKVWANPKARFGVDTTFGCSPFTIKVSNTSPGLLNTYYWDFGNGVRDTSFTNGVFNYTYNIGNAVDTFTIRLIAENRCGRDTQSINVRVAPNIIRPLINVNSSQLYGCTPHDVSFSNNTSGATSFTWNFGDNTPPLITNNNQSSIVHRYTTAGVFTVTIAITNGCSDTTVLRQVTVFAKPAAVFTTSAAVYCAGDTIRVTNNSTGANNYSWFWGDGTSDGGANPVHVYPVAGNYNILLYAERNINSGTVCFDTISKAIAVLAKPVVTFQSNINVINCAPFKLNVSATGIISGQALTWYFYDSTVTPSIDSSDKISAQYTFNKPGSFYVKLVAVNAQGCKDSTILRFTVRGKPVASFTPASLAVCTRDTTVTYLNTTTYNGIDRVNYLWLVDNVVISNNAGLTHRYNVLPNAVLPKVFTTKLVASNTVGCSDTAVATLQMNPVAKAQFSISNPNDCVPFKPVILNASAYTTSYRWLLNGITVSNVANPDMVITKPSTVYTITLIADNIYGCKPDTLSVTFTSRVKPAAAFRLSDTLGCTGVLNIATTNLTTGASSYSWNWGDGTANNPFRSPTYLYTTPGQYLITLVAGDGVCTDTISQLVKVSIKPVVDFSADQPVTCDTARVKFTNLTTNGANYTWSFGDGSFSTVNEPIHSFAPGIVPYTVKLVATGNFGCKDSAVKANLVLAKIPPASGFFISPSPVITVPNYTFSFNNLTLNSVNYKYLWSLGDGTSASTRDITFKKYADTGNYTIRLIVLDTATNCADTTIKIARIDGFPGYLYVPNAICPACIQSNLREFLPKGTGLKEYRLQIYTTWNELIFETRVLDSKGAPTQAWDGKFKGTIVQQDVYVWRIDAKFLNGSEWLGMIYPGDSKYKKAGTITVVK
ncbi:MAG: PKD domain-containing protein [Ferruginibacter sp.]|nr:PKD domain-containing protein [Ferruginibacter sp.]